MSAEQMSVAIISFNTRDVLRQCLQSLLGQTNDIRVFDNGSSDGTQAMLSAEFPSVVVVTSESNLGYGAAANRLIAAVSSAYVLLLNTDTHLQAQGLERLQGYLDQHPRVAIAGPRLVNPDGSLQPSCFHFPSPLFALLRATALGRLLGHIPALRERYLLAWSHDRPRAVPWVMGAALAIRRTAFEAVGGFDESFFMYSEEVDLCYRLRAAGWRIDFAPVTDVTHLGGASSGQQPHGMEEEKYASTAHFYRAHYSAWQRGLLKLIVSYEMARNTLRDQRLQRSAVDPTRRAHLAAQLALWRRIWRRQWRSGAPA